MARLSAFITMKKISEGRSGSRPDIVPRAGLQKISRGFLGPF
jgi:hypothetical protein